MVQKDWEREQSIQKDEGESAGYRGRGADVLSFPPPVL